MERCWIEESFLKGVDLKGCRVKPLYGVLHEKMQLALL
jgi:hypothetical protein